MSLVYRENQAAVAGILSLVNFLEKPFDSGRARDVWYNACMSPCKRSPRVYDEREPVGERRWTMRSVPRAVGVLTLMLCVGATPIEAAKERDLAVMPKVAPGSVAPGSVASGGSYWARLIGIDQYQQRNVPKLQSAVKGAQAVREVLVQRSGFEGDTIIIESINGQATPTHIEDGLDQLRAQAGMDDPVVIYNAGHDQIETDNKQIELANVLDMAKRLDREIIGNDGAPMVLVPEGEFLYGNDNQRLSLLDFYMDKYEVTTAQYAKFMAATSTTAPQIWQISVPVSDGQKPVVGVDWDEANAYCRYYGQRLPTEQEWEKAARGTDGRKYPWGDDEPTSRHANFNNCCDFWNSDVLFNVGSLEDGKSPYGIYDLAGNVYEWTSSDHHGRAKVIRGGSWMNQASSLDSSLRGWHSPWDLSDHDGFRCVQDAR